MDYNKIVHEVVEQYRVSPIDMLGIGDANEYGYLANQKPAYVRTMRDIDSLWQDGKRDKRVLEIGSFLGPVSISLRQMGYGVNALDIPEFHQSPSLRALYARHDIPFAGVNLRKYKLPYDSGSFDAVVMCEVLEHLNFNPLPVLKEINRVLKKGGYVYIAMPNQAYFLNRIKLLVGRSIHEPLQHFFNQLDRKDNMIVGLHWREYTAAETVKLIECMGFGVRRAYYFLAPGHHIYSGLKGLFERLCYCVPSLRPQQVVVGQKTSEPSYDFWLTEANS